MPNFAGSRIVRSDIAHKALCAAMALLLMVVYSLAAVSHQAGAAGPLPAPTNLAPNGGGNAGPNPVLTWNAVPGAKYYKVTHPDQNGNARTDTVYAASFATTVDYPLGTVNWSVTGYDSANAAGDTANASFNNQATNGPTLSCPTSPVNFPAQSPKFTWTAVPGVKTYTLSVSTTPTFVPDSTDTFATQSTSYTLTTGQSDGQLYYAKVSGTSYNGVNTPASASCSYSVVWSAATTGANDATVQLQSPTNGASVRDVILRWAPLKGSASYEVQVSPNGDWTNNLYYDIISDSTTWSPAKTLDNGSYFWRVRGIDNQGNKSQWSDSTATAWQFTVTPLATPVALYPAADVTIANPDLRFSWKPVAGAGAYEIQWDDSSSFSYANQNDEINHTCFTNHTDWSPYQYETPPGVFRGPGGNACNSLRRDQSPGFVDGTTIWWHVRAIDDYTQNEVASPWNTTGFNVIDHKPSTNQAFVSTWSTPRRFFTNSDVPALIGPTGSIPTPTMAWTRVDGAQYYLVSYTTSEWGWDSTNNVCTAPTSSANHTAKTSALSYTPSLVGLPRHPTNGQDHIQCPINVSYTVQSVDWSDRESPVPPTRSFTWSGYSAGVAGSTITLAPTSVNGTSGEVTNPADGATISGIPHFAWTAVSGADHYQLRWFDNPSGSVFTAMQDYNFSNGQTDPLTESFTPVQPLPAGAAGAWQVVALAGSTVIAASPRRTITIARPDDVTLTAFTTRKQDGTAVTCTSGCVTPSTPLISWATEPDVSYYRVIIAQDENFTNIVRIYDTEQNSLRPVEALPDNQAGQSYYVFVQPAIANWWTGANATGTIYGDSNAVVDPSHIWSFHKQSNPVTNLEVRSPTSTVGTPSSTSICDDGANATTVGDVPTFCWDASSTVPYASGDLGAMSYHIQVSTTADFSNIIDQAWVDQPSYSPYAWPATDNGGYSPGSSVDRNGIFHFSHKTYPDGPLYWRVQAIDATGNGLTYSPTQTVTKSSAAVSLNSPTAGASVGGTPSLSWASKTFAARYQVQVARNGDTNFSNPNLAFNQYTDLTSITPSNNNNLISGTSLPQGSYAWRVRAVDADNNSGAWSVVRTFTVSPAAPSLTSPSNSASFTTLDPLTFRWGTVTGAVRYRFHLSQSNPPTTGIQVDTVSNAWSLDRNLANGTWYWQVDALDAQNLVLATSGVRSFTYNGNRPGVSGQKATLLEGAVALSWQTSPVDAVGPVTSFTIDATDTTNAGNSKSVTVDPGDTVVPPGSGAAGSSTVCTGTGTLTCAYVLKGLTNGDNYNIRITPNDANGPGDSSGNIGARPQKYSPFGNGNSCASWVYRSLRAASPSTGETNIYGSMATNTGCTVATYDIWKTDGFQSMFAVARLYHAYFLRAPDNSGLRFWMSKRATPGTYWTLDHISSNFAGSSEFKHRYGSLSNSQFVNLIYQNVLHRSPVGDSGFTFWVKRLNSGAYTRGKVMTGFSEANEFKNLMMVQIKAEMIVLTMLHRSPTPAELTYYEGLMPSTNGAASDVQTALRMLMVTQEFGDVSRTNPMS